MTHITTHPDALASVPPRRNVAPFYDLDVMRADPQCHVNATRLSIPADRVGFHIDPAGAVWLTVEHPTAAGHPFTLLGLDDDHGRTEALAVLCRVAVALQSGDGLGAVLIDVEHRGAAGGRVLDPTMADHLTIVAASYLTAEGIEVR